MSNICYLGIKTLILHNLKIFFKEFYYNTITALISSIIFITILNTITKFYVLNLHNEIYMNFVIPGIILMVIIQETFGNISGNIIWMKHHGTFDNFLLSPLSRIELFFSFLITIWIIGLVISIINLIVIYIFIQFNFYNFFRFFYYISLTTLFFGSIGSIVGFLSYKWEMQQSFFSFIIVPISLLSGTFFSLEIFESKWKDLLFINPFYHLIANARKSFYLNDAYNLEIDLLLILMIFLIIYISLYIYKKGYKVIY